MITIAKEKNDRVLAMRQIMAYVTKEDVLRSSLTRSAPVMQTARAATPRS